MYLRYQCWPVLYFSCDQKSSCSRLASDFEVDEIWETFSGKVLVL